YGTINEEVYVMQPPGFQDPSFPAKVYKVEQAMYGLHQAPRAWYVAFSDSDYDGASQDRKSTNGGSQFLGRRLISWQCKKQTIIATSTTEAEYVAAASCCGQVLWIQNQLLDYGLSMSCEDLSKEISISILCLLIPLVSKDDTTVMARCKTCWSFSSLRHCVCMRCAVTFKGLTIDARIHTAKTFDLVWIWLGGDYGNVFLNGF
nr:putative ribonuclease H-like domain-containing protein [Tanacetum cinerariifolium]